MEGAITAAFSFLVSWLKTNLWTPFRAVFVEVFKRLAEFFTTLWGVLVLIAGWFWTVVVFIKDSIGDVLQGLADLVLPTVSVSLASSITSYASLANTVAPLQEAMVFLVAYLGMLIVLTIYRLVKSWIPTLS